MDYDAKVEGLNITVRELMDQGPDILETCQEKIERMRRFVDAGRNGTLNADQLQELCIWLRAQLRSELDLLRLQMRPRPE